MNNYLERAQTVLERVNELAVISDQHGLISRTFGTEAFWKAQRKIAEWMTDAGLETKIDNIGNVRGKLRCSNQHAKTFFIGSHFDTVVNAGKFDGPLGIIAGLDIIIKVIAEGYELPFNIELVAFSDEEGVRFHTTYLGSKVLTGAFDMELLERKDDDGVSMHEVVTDLGATIKHIPADAIAAGEWLGYYEIHIEQGPVLYGSEDPVAVVTSIAGQKRFAIMYSGTAGHAGTVPMDLRQDALCAAAEFITKIEAYAKAGNERFLATVGKLEITNAASNVIPGEVIFSLDLRSGDEEILERSAKDLEAFAKEIASRRSLKVFWKVIQENHAVHCDEHLVKELEEAISASGFNPVKLVSGAGHDAVPISEVAPVVMLFVRCYKGISHNPLEDVEIKDIAAALQVSDLFLKALSKKI